jgi:hypothetical protein
MHTLTAARDYSNSGRVTRLLVFLACLLQSPPAGAQVSDTIVKAAEEARHPGIAEVRETLTIGVRDGSPDYSFTNIADVVIGPNQSMLVLEALVAGHASAVRLYDANGRFVRNVGRPGKGPGEYRSVSAVAVLADGSHLVLDRGGRLLRFSSMGEHLATWPVPPFAVRAGPDRMRVDAHGYVAVRIVTRTREFDHAEAIVRIRPDGVVLDTLPEPQSFVRSQPIVIAPGNNPGPRWVLNAPYSPELLWEWSPLGFFVTAASDRYAIDLRLPTPGAETDGTPPVWRPGDPVVSLRRDVIAVPVSAAERRDWRRWLDDRIRAAGRTRSTGRNPTMPVRKPFFQRIYVGDEGRIWVVVHVPSERSKRSPESGADDGWVGFGWREQLLIDVFEPGGTYVGRVRLPDGADPVAFRGDQIWASVRDEFDVPYLKRYTVVW